MSTITATLDERDEQLRAERAAAIATITKPQVGDFVIFADGTERRISHDWDEWIQTSDGGSWYLGDGYVSFSGSLHPTVPTDTLTDTGEQKEGRVCLCHHDVFRAHNGVDCMVPFRVWSCSVAAPR